MTDQTAAPASPIHSGTRLPSVVVDSYNVVTRTDFSAIAGGILTIGTGLGNARFTNRSQADD